MQKMKRVWTPNPPPKCPRAAVQSLPRRPGRVRVKKKLEGKFQRRRVCPPMQMLPPSIMLSLLAEAPTPMGPPKVDREKCATPEIPRVCVPLAPLEPIVLPPSDSFGSTSPAPPVGESDGEDGGIPRRVERRTATVMPPLFLTPACTKRVAKAVWTCVDPAPVLEPPQQIVVPTISHASSSTELVKGAFTDLPSGEGFPAMLAAVCDPPRTCKECNQQSTARPLRKRTPPTYTAVHCGMRSSCEGSGKDDLTGLAGVLAIFGDAPRLRFTTRIQEIIRDVPRRFSRRCAPPTAAPHVPVVPEPALASWVKTGVAARESERPHLVPGTNEAAIKALETLDMDLRNSTSTSSSWILVVMPPESIKRESVVQPRWMGVKFGGDSSPFDQNELYIMDVPVWRDAPSDATDNANMPPPSPGPVWRDSELLRGPDTRDTGDVHSQLLETKNLRRTARVPSSSTSRRSRSPLGTLLRRKRSEPKSSAVVTGGGKKDTNRTRASNRKKRRPEGEAIWRDSPVAPRMLVDPTRLLNLISGVEAPPKKTIGNWVFSGSAVALDGIGAASPLVPPPNDKSPKANRDWRRMTHPLRACRKDDQGLLQGRFPARERAVRPTVHVAESLPGSTALPRSRDSSSGSLLATSASSAASFWRSITSIPDGTPAQARGLPPFSGGTRLRSQIFPVPPRAPAFEPRGGSAHHRTRTNRRSRQHREPVPGKDTQL